MAYDLNHSGGIGSNIDTLVSGTVTSVLSGGLTIDPAPMDVKVTGDVNNPVCTQITGNPASPVGAQITGNPASPVGAQITGNPDLPVGTRITGDPGMPVASTIDILNLPHLKLTDIKEILKPNVRMHIPNYQQMSFKILGVELFSWCLSGETEVIAQPYHPNRFEQCNIECPDEDKRSFPEETPTHEGIRRNSKKYK
jgi:hypothetical protein